jgi:hypothetical protein
MSTYYYVGCERCKQYGGSITRQAWGWGNMDIVETHAFICNHIAECGEENLRFISEHSDQMDEWTWVTGFPERPDDPDDPFEPKSASYSYPTFPHSDDWGCVDDLKRQYMLEHPSRKAARE